MPALQAMQDKRIKDLLRSMITETFPMSEGMKAIEKAQTKGVLKIQIVM